MIAAAPDRKTRKFRDPSEYSLTSEYQLLPFRFHVINDEREVLVNEVGDFLLVDRGTVDRLVHREIDREAESELYADLLAGFFISDEPTLPLLDVLATRYRTKKAFLDNFTALHIFVLTLRCEHTCHYCQVSRVTADKNAFNMSYAHLDKGIDLMMQSPNPHVTMEFQGGEAFLAFDTLQYAVERAERLAAQHGKHITFVACTNLAIVTPEMLAYCHEHSILISTSLDGPEFIHNANRHRPKRNSYELTINGIGLARAAVGPDRVSALMTTSNLSLEHPLAIVDEYVAQGFNSIFLRPISPYGFALRSDKKNKYATDAFLAFYKTALAHILDLNFSGIQFREDYTTIILRKMLTPFPIGYVDLQSPAGLINSVVVFNYDGAVYASDEARMLAEMNDLEFRLGHLDTHTYQELFYGAKAQQIAAVWANEALAGCSECAFQSYCGADPVLHHATQGDMYGHRPTSVFCQKNMEIIRYLFELMDRDARIERIFRGWVSNFS
ncbi:His-Xaa-Ser system radical SAM maturase HxsB [Hymenobacter monticola]|uniref:His-Xaa-Ser system radical SAM maturase HxsB n=1 Tax=Hymenobacter monticola TaxID=1705399 RepID=A0ABY4B2C4_9BACT|nr:His-Xaa-Ser system radical SAM maturase HxsB [Hymenobacter monticola]UOE33290.1 His-Xaa-Ser system radical SAM maturase HxsB [Hymenobacter monticola]